MIEILLAIIIVCIICLIHPSGLTQFVYFVIIRIHRSKWRHNFIKRLLKGKPHLTTKGFCTVQEEIDLIDNVDKTLTDRISFCGFHEDGTMITFSQVKVANVKKNRVTFRNSSKEIFVWEDDVIEQKTVNKVFTGKMNLTVLEPMRKWRIIFQGFLKSVSGGEKSVYANISVLWQCSSDPYECAQNNTLWSFAKFSAERLIDYNQLKKMITGQTFRFDQWGELCGTLDIDQSGENFFRFTSPRSRSFSKLSERDGNTRTIHYIKLKDKCWMLMLMKDYLCDFKILSGYIAYPNGEIWPLTLKDGASDSTVNKPFMEETAFTQDGECKVLKILIQIDEKVFADETFKRYHVNDEAAFGCQLTEETKHVVFKMNLETSAIHKYAYDEEVSNIPLVISMKDSLCKRPDLVGGKGASLSKLLDMEDDLGVIIPIGFCVTTKAYIEHIRENKELSCSIESIHYCIRNKQIEQLLKCCENATQCMARTRMSDVTQAILMDQLHTHFGSGYENECLAVRSSAVGEDGLESSSAGQMETILNVKGYDSIIQAILKCWASSLSFNIVEYRRQYGQRLTEPMAVVVQKMIKSEVSGVLFTADPLTNKGSTIVINAFPGLGEVVVSGKSNIDTIFITRTLDQHLDIRKRVSAENKHDGDKCTYEQDICLQDEMALKICQVAILIEVQFGGHVDIEWAVAKRCVYILQARPIISVAGETDEDLMHEFDTPVTDSKECLTTGNIGEMLPDIATPLTIDLFGRAVDLATKIMHGCSRALRYSTYASMLVRTFYYRMFISLSVICSMSISSLVSDKSKVEMFIMGETLPENSVQNLISFRGRKPSRFSRLIRLLKARFETRRAEKILRSYEIILQDTRIIHHSTDLNDLMEEIESNHEHYFKLWTAAMYQNAESAIGSAILMSVLCGKLNKITPDVSADLASLLSNCKNVYSADVPTMLADLAKIIDESNQKDYFLHLSAEESHAFLISSDIFGEKYRLFLERHGHRCVREADFLELSWAMDPKKLIQSLKALISHGIFNIRTEPQTTKEIVENLRSPLTSFQKFLFRSFLVSVARKGVAKREWGKSLAIKMGDVLKQAYWKLADLMVQESRLPEQDLLFFLTHREIKTLIETRSPELVRKSRKRRNISQSLLLYSFKKVNYGAPIPLPMDVERSGSPTFEGQGMPVSRGIVTGRACVIKDISEVGQIHKGDILICMFTDVGWTPYFPLLSGLVTEIGGLLSHGAVVAREFGLPCVVCMSNATKLFKTGDIVKLNATEGSLCKIERKLKISK
ncbi:hypothetical protein CHS0354_001338 [Potamilus streckersoni]|uniref:Phosphoenolpyruvate synthase n=1 Tax=Potamilus streckersoni TaxID=2493646 RepID=A0AAE0TA46_9BIVA|nr:hypothetical protein CHS0354_001338 [Potamilus streckersoni]